MTINDHAEFLRFIAGSAIGALILFTISLYRLTKSLDRRLAASEEKLTETRESLDHIQQELRELLAPLAQVINRQGIINEVDCQILSTIPIRDLGKALATRPPLVRTCLVTINATEEFIRKVIGINDSEVEFWRSKNDGKCQLQVSCNIEEWTTHTVFHAGWNDKAYSVYDCDVGWQTQWILWHIEFPRTEGESSSLRIEAVWSRHGITLWAHGGRYGRANFEYGALDENIYAAFSLSERELAVYLRDDQAAGVETESEVFLNRKEPWLRAYEHDDPRGLRWYVEIKDFQTYLVERG